LAFFTLSATFSPFSLSPNHQPAISGVSDSAFQVVVLPSINTHLKSSK
jgi:hypothetical protein